MSLWLTAIGTIGVLWVVVLLLSKSVLEQDGQLHNIAGAILIGWCLLVWIIGPA